MKKVLQKFYEYLPYILIIMVIGIICVVKNSQNDIYFDIRSAKDLLKYGLDFKDHFSFLTDLTYLYHHYLYDLILYFIFKIAKFGSVFVFFLAIFTSFGFIVFYVSNKYTKNKIIALINTLITMFFMKGYFQTRVQSLTYIIFYLEIYFLNRLYDEGKIKDSVIVILLSILLVNLHMPVWIIYLVFFLPYFQEIFFDILREMKITKFFSNKLEIKSPKNLNLLFITFGIVLLTGFVSPFKLETYTFFLKVLNNDGYESISEMQRTIVINNGALILVAIYTIVTLSLTKKKIRIRDFFFILGLGLMSLFAFRHCAYFICIVPTIVFATVFKDIKIKEFKFLKRINLNIVRAVLIVILIGVYVLCFKAIDLKTFDYHEKDNYPVKSADYIINNLDYKNIRLYNEFNYGSYLAYRNIPVFIDSRAEVYMKRFNKRHDIMQDFKALKQYSNYKAIMQLYKFDYALVYKSSDLYYYLYDDKDFIIVFEEDTKSYDYVLFKKR